MISNYSEKRREILSLLCITWMLNSYGQQRDDVVVVVELDGQHTITYGETVNITHRVSSTDKVLPTDEKSSGVLGLLLDLLRTSHRDGWWNTMVVPGKSRGWVVVVPKKSS